MPEGIAVTFSQSMIADQGGLKRFLQYFEKCMGDEDSVWLHKCRNKPAHDALLQYVYVIVCNRVYYRCNYAGYAVGETYASKANAATCKIDWSRILLAGPLIKAPVKIIRPGFQGFRYATKIF